MIAISLTKSGDFYEAYGDDARTVSASCGVTLTRRNSMPLTGFPVMALAAYVAKLMAEGVQMIIIQGEQ